MYCECIELVRAINFRWSGSGLQRCVNIVLAIDWCVSIGHWSEGGRQCLYSV